MLDALDKLIFAGVLALALGSLLGFSSGCGATSTVVTHARAAAVAAPVITAAGEVIHDARALELDACLDEPCLDAGEARWAPAVAAYNLTREGWVAWLEAMQLAAIAQTPDAEVTTILLPLVLALVRLYDGVETALEPFDDLEIPDFPGLGLLIGGE